MSFSRRYLDYKYFAPRQPTVYVTDSPYENYLQWQSIKDWDRDRIECRREGLDKLCVHIIITINIKKWQTVWLQSYIYFIFFLSFFLSFFLPPLSLSLPIHFLSLFLFIFVFLTSFATLLYLSFLFLPFLFIFLLS